MIPISEEAWLPQTSMSIPLQWLIMTIGILGTRMTPPNSWTVTSQSRLAHHSRPRSKAGKQPRGGMAGLPIFTLLVGEVQ